LNLKNLNDRELLFQTQQLVQSEREVLTKILHHLREVDRRKLFSDQGYQSLFEYAVKDLKYSEGQAGRRIQAMRLIKEIPELEKKVESGDLSLSNISQAQSYFRETQKTAPQMKMDSSEKLKVLKSLENKSAREGQKLLISLQPQVALPRERERILDDSHTESTFVKTKELGQQLDEVRSLLGPKGASLSMAELVGEMAVISIRVLKIRKFGKRRLQELDAKEDIKGDIKEDAKEVTNGGLKQEPKEITKGAVKQESEVSVTAKKLGRTPTSESRYGKNPRYISRAIRYEVWNRDQGKCRICDSQWYLNFDHIKPVALGGQSTFENIRLLCSPCNQRQAIKVFGADRIPRSRLQGKRVNM